MQALVIWIKKQALVWGLEELPQGQGQTKGSVGTGELVFCIYFPRGCRRRKGQRSGGEEWDRVIGIVRTV